MKLIKRFLMALFSAVICAGLWSAVAYADETEPEILNDPVEGEILLNETNFPDANFLEYVRSFNTDQNESLSMDERAAVTAMDISGKGVISTQGIRFFPELQSFTCQSGGLNNLDEIGSCTKLVVLDVYDNSLVSLDLSTNTALMELNCGKNSLFRLDLSKNTDLRMVNCALNSISELKLGSCELLNQLICHGNSFTKLYVSLCPVIVNAINEQEPSSPVDGWSVWGDVRNPVLMVNSDVEVITELATGEIPITENTFPDEYFRNWVSDRLDEDYSATLSEDERAQVEVIYCNRSSIADLTGIEHFPNLSQIMCQENQLTSLDLSHNPEMEWLNCSNNAITSLDLSNNPKIKQVYCSDCSLESLNLTGCEALNLLRCHRNQLTSLDVSDCKKLVDLQSYGNSFEQLDISNCPDLVFLFCGKSPLKSIDVSKNPKLREFTCSSCKIQSLDVSNNPALELLNCQLTDVKTLDISKNEKLLQVYKTGRKSSKTAEDVNYVIYELDRESDPRYPASLSFNETVELITSPRVTELFDDVKEGAWYVPAVQYAYDNGLMVGKGNKFGVSDALKREQFVQTLYSMSGKPEVGADVQNPFTDVPDTKYPRDAILWANENRIAKGNADGTFGVGKSIQRQAVAVMLYKYAEMRGFNLDANPGAIDGFSDASKVENWAKSAMEWAVTQGIIAGKGGNKLDPKGNASRAECAAMLMKLVEKNP